MDKETLQNHKGHKLEIVTYGKDGVVYNIALECLDCCEVLEDFDY